MKTKTSVVVLLTLAAALMRSQSPGTEGAREYFFLGVQKKDTLPAVRPAMAHRTGRTSYLNTGAVHLALRYNLLLVDPPTKRSRAVDPDRIFKQGDCLALELSSNRSGYLLVYSKGSSGNWQALLPSPDMKDETNVIDPGEKIQVPNGHCFEIRNPPGQEELFIVLSRDPVETYQLQQHIAAPAAPAAPAEAQPQMKAPDPELTEMADARSINSDVAQLAHRFESRDLVIVKTGETPVKEEVKMPEEAPHTVYVANRSPHPTANLVTRILIRHR